MARSSSLKTIHSVGGTHTHIVIELQQEGSNVPFIYLGSAITISYSVHRDKVPVFNCGSSIADGFSLGNKYVAGSLITMMNDTDEFSSFMDSVEQAQSDDPYLTIENVKRGHSFMRDDLVPFNIHLVFASEYSPDLTRIIIYGATFINNGQVMSINDIITENTVSFVATEIDEQHNMSTPRTSHGTSAAYIKATQLV